MNQGIQVLRDYISNNWEDRWSPVAGDLAPYPRPRLFGGRRNPDQPPLFLPEPSPSPPEADAASGAGPSHQPHPHVSHRKRARGASGGDATLAGSPSQASPPLKRVTRSNTGPEGLQSDTSAPVKIGRPTRSSRTDKGKAKDTEAVDDGSPTMLRRSSRSAARQKKEKLASRK